MEEYKVLITTSGLGSRLGDLTDYTNKSLIRVGDKPALSHIIESYSKESNFVITLGHYGNHVKEFLIMAYPEYNFTFIEVKNYKGKNSSLLHSISTAKKELQCPFIYHVCDAIILDNIKKPKENWIAGVSSETSEQYRTINASSKMNLLKINQKGEINYDFVYPGLIGVKDFKEFWECLEYTIENCDIENIKNLSDCHVIEMMIKSKNIKFKINIIQQWFDIGEPFALNKTKEFFKSSMNVLDKVQENIYIVNNYVIKFFHDKKLVSNRVERARILNNLVPKIVSSSSNFFKYRYVEGNLFSNSANPNKMSVFLSWALKNMWKKGKSSENITDYCYNFYFKKTKKRICALLDGEADVVSVINDITIPTVETMMKSIDENWLCDGIATIIHGDLILDNIIETTSGFSLIDWRQDFAERIDIGDVYYDLAKLNHNLIFNHELVNNEHYILKYEKKGIICDILCKKNLIDCRTILHSFIKDNGYDLEKVNMLTSLIWINMSPLHDYPLNKFLFNFGKYNLFLALNKKEAS